MKNMNRKLQTSLETLCQMTNTNPKNIKTLCHELKTMPQNYQNKKKISKYLMIQILYVVEVDLKVSIMSEFTQSYKNYKEKTK